MPRPMLQHRAGRAEQISAQDIVSCAHCSTEERKRQ
nr:MAG TPA_asm: hypothetical protein [Caudoviricetes sp.]